MSSTERSRTIDAPADAVWDVLADFGALSRWVPMIQHSCLLSDQEGGVGAVRRVQIGPQTLVERVTSWQSGAELGYAIAGLPPIVGAATNTWTLTPTAGGTRVTLTTEIDTGANPIKLVVARKVLERMAFASDQMLDGLSAALADGERRQEDET